MSENIRNIVVQKFETERLCVIELTETVIDFGKSIEEVMEGESFSVTKRVALDSNNFPPLPRGKEKVCLCLLQIKDKQFSEAIEEIRKLKLIPEEFPVLDFLKRWCQELLKEGVEIVVALGINSVYHYAEHFPKDYHYDEKGHHGINSVCIDFNYNGHFGLYDDEFMADWGGDLWFVFRKEAIAQLLPQNP